MYEGYCPGAIVRGILSEGVLSWHQVWQLMISTVCDAPPTVALFLRFLPKYPNTLTQTSALFEEYVILDYTLCWFRRVEALLWSIKEL